LAEAERRATEGIEHVERQKQIVAKLHADGQDAAKAVELLTIRIRFRMQLQHEQHLAQLIKVLSERLHTQT
jgi:hypothetical protein